MINLQVVLIDDELHNLSNLEALLTQYCPNVTIVGKATNVDEGLKVIAATHPDLLLLDIQMPGANGFDLLRKLQNRTVEVIFVTAYDRYGIQAIKFSALDYLLKPINITELKDAVNKASERIGSKQQHKRWENLLETLEKTKDLSSHRMALPSLRETRLVPVATIVRCESDNNYTNFFLISGEEIVVSKPIYEYEELLTPYGFLRCHQSHLVNKSHVVSFIKEDEGYLMLVNGHRVPISRRRKDEVKMCLGL